MAETELLKMVLKRLDLLILLMLDRSSESIETTTTAKINRLLALGLSPTETAAIIGKPTKYVTSIIARNKSKRKKGD